MQRPTVLRVVVVERQDVEGGAAFVLLPEVEVVALYVDQVLLVVQVLFHIVKSHLLPRQTFFPELVQFVLVFVVGLVSRNLIVCVEVLLEPIGFMNKVGRDRVGPEDLGRVNVLVEAASPLLQPLFLKGLSVFGYANSAGVDGSVLHGVGIHSRWSQLFGEVWSETSFHF